MFRADCQLQCGHGRAAVESGWVAEKIRPGDFTLQCGHGRAAVESMKLWGMVWNSFGFNVATAARPCILTSRLFVMLEIASLQFGLGRAAVESRLSARTLLFESGCFNVATAARPWNRFSPGRMRETQFSFNVATAARPWNQQLISRTSLHGFGFNVARPRGRGINATGEQVRRSIHRFNVATAARPWTRAKTWAARITGRWLQCGHGRAAVESLSCFRAFWLSSLLQCGHGRAAVESFRERFDPVPELCRFNVAPAAGPWHRVRSLRSRLPDPWLQCGHGRAAVESRSSLPSRRGTSRLQCGHGRAAVESGCLKNAPSDEMTALQCGHGRAAVESSAFGRLRAEGSAGFNVATAARPWNPKP